MPIIPTTHLTPGARTSRDIVAKNGTKLLSSGTVLSQYIIQYLNRWQIKSVYIQEESIEIVSTRKRNQQQSTQLYESTIAATEGIMVRFKGISRLKLKEIRKIIDDISSFSDISLTLDAITQINNQSKYTYHHSVNVAIYCSFIGKSLKLEDALLKKLIYAGFLHDIGKTQISPSILSKPGKLNDQEFQEIKSHPIYGYHLVRENTLFSHDIALGVLQHHEREDGKGYPLGINGEQIHLFGKIIAVADIFDAMTSTRPYKGKQSALKIAEELMNDYFGVLDQKIVRTFVSKLSDFYIGSRVILENGDVGEIIAKNPDSPMKPLIKIGNRFIDLSVTPSMKILDILVF
ncbi:metal dependent phosphohydrolase [Alkaliphilus metalliredigens QYMF]|uniref:Metal dependent phosphohydrolase n=1 Tax=Alkaliphilus metalliredigens (strain QYMF) TaxID=293826 RepID=A6TKN6_ALKMQ|nr:HD-GYP domain-containing protein [Alkaliphilus metalliredigens]ABR46754.1 metal dependent phosphohydrolase [Alkaliphilus metalliredigens QYMF]